MGDKKKTMKAFMAIAPWLMYEDKDEVKQQWKSFKGTVEKYFEQLQDIQQTVIEARKEQWNKIFPKLLEMQDNFAAALPQQLPGAPEGTITPKKAVEKVKEFQIMANNHAMEQAESVIDFCKQGQEKVKEAVTDAVSSIEEKAE